MENSRGWAGARMATPLVAAVAVVCAPTGAVAAVDHPDPATLVRGIDSRVPYLQDGVLTAGGRSIRVGVRYDGERQALLGESGKGWLVASGRNGVARVHLVRRGKASKLLRKASEEYNPGRDIAVRLSRGGKRLIWTSYDRGGEFGWVRAVSDGRPLSDTEEESPGRPIDAEGDRVLTTGGDEGGWWGTVVWRAGQPSERVTRRRVSGGLLARDLLFVHKGPGLYGPTSISDPGTPPWSAAFTPLDLSPDGTRVLGRATARVKGRDVVQVRRMSDGRILRAWTAGRVKPEGRPAPAREQTARFETNQKVVLEVTRKGRTALVRCRVVGPCTRASKLGGPVSFGFESFSWAYGPSGG